MGWGPPFDLRSPPSSCPKTRGTINRTMTSPRRKRNIRYHDHEWDRIVAYARACGVPAATFVRRVSLGAKPRLRRDRTDNELILRLGQIATDLHRLVRPAEQADDCGTRAKLERALDEALAAIRRVG